DGLSLGVLHRQMEGYLCELKRRTVRRREGEVPARFGFYGAENVGCAAALVFVVAPCFPSWCSRRGWADVGMQRDWLLVQTHHRFLWIVGFFIRFQNVLHLGDVVFIEFGYAPHFFPATALSRGGGFDFLSSLF